MRILLSNDDSAFAKGIETLYRVLSTEHEVVVIAPDRNCSGASNALTLLNPLRTQILDNGFIAVNGTPTDCVHLGLSCFNQPPFDLVVSGINHGANLGDDVIYSGTVAAASEGRHMGKPALAISLASHQPEYFITAAQVALEFIRELDEHPLGKQQIININVPDVPYESLAGRQVCRLGRRHKAELMQRSQDPWGREIFWYGKLGAEEDADQGTDFWAIRHNYVAVTPISVDMTDHHALDAMRVWMDR